MSNVVKQHKEVVGRIDMACKRSERAPSEVELIIVSKTFGAEDITPLLDDNCRVFGENRVQEAQSKWVDLKEKYSDIELHLIGPLQSNKSEDAVALFDVIQTVDREKIAKMISSEMKKQGREIKLFVQVNTGSEPQKAGILPKEAVAFVTKCQEEYGLKISGLMCIPPFDENPGPHFALLRKLAGEAGVNELSMGMSGDFETAVEFGATSVRVGSAIFGGRG